MKKLVPLLLTLLIVGCGQKRIDTQKACEEMLQADRDFSAYSATHGKNAAFEKFAADDVTFLTENSYPLVGLTLLKERQSQRPDTSYMLTWEPTYARAAESGELGYTYGTWEIKAKSDPGKISKGTYVTIWQKSKNGEWKYVLDTGHSGLGDEKKQE
jgi:ketosteroid isomerase-like protein